MKTLFDPIASEHARDDGMATAAANRAKLLAFARTLAIELAMAREDRSVTADDVQRALVERGYGVHELGNAAGSLFRASGWQWTGMWQKSQRVHSHANLLRVWRWVG